MEDNKNGRLVWIDISKAVAMLLVLIGHSMNDSMRMASPALDVLYRSIYIFHMTWFFWLSGYVYRLSRNKGKAPVKIAKRRMRSQLPYWILYTLFIYLVFNITISIPALKPVLNEAGFQRMPFGIYLLSALQANNVWAYHLWFLQILIIITIVVSFADYITKGKNIRVFSICLIAISVVALALRDYVFLGNWWRLYQYMTLYLPVFCIGILMADMKISDAFAWVWGILAIVYIAVRVKYFSDFSGNSLRVTGWVRVSVYLAADILLPGLMVLLGKLLEKVRSSFLLFIGKESLTIYLWHQPFCCAFLGTILYNRLHLPAVLVMLICICTSLCITYPIIIIKNKIRNRVLSSESRNML